MKILLINDTLVGGGKERRIVQLILGLKRVHGIDVHIAVLDRPASHNWKKKGPGPFCLVDYPEIFESGAQVHILERKSKKDLLEFVRLWKLIREVKPDIINVWSIMGSFYSTPIAAMMGIPQISSFVANCNTPKKYSLQWIVSKIAISYSRCVTGNSHAGLVAYGVPDSKSTIIYNGFDFHRLDNLKGATSVKDELGVATQYMVGMVARFDDSKDYETFLHAANHVLEKRIDVSFVCLGQGPNLERCQRIVIPKFKDRVIFLGYRDDVESIVSACDVTVLCTNDGVHKEGVSNSILESMAVGTPVIATNAGGSPEIVENGTSGYLIPPGDIASVANGIEIILDDSLLRTNMGNRSIQVIREKFSIESMISKFQKIYSSSS